MREPAFPDRHHAATITRHGGADLADPQLLKTWRAERPTLCGCATINDYATAMLAWERRRPGGWRPAR